MVVQSSPSMVTFREMTCGAQAVKHREILKPRANHGQPRPTRSTTTTIKKSNTWDFLSHFQTHFCFTILSPWKIWKLDAVMFRWVITPLQSCSCFRFQDSQTRMLQSQIDKHAQGSCCTWWALLFLAHGLKPDLWDALFMFPSGTRTSKISHFPYVANNWQPTCQDKVGTIILRAVSSWNGPSILLWPTHPGVALKVCWRLTELAESLPWSYAAFHQVARSALDAFFWCIRMLLVNWQWDIKACWNWKLGWQWIAMDGNRVHLECLWICLNAGLAWCPLWLGDASGFMNVVMIMLPEPLVCNTSRLIETVVITFDVNSNESPFLELKYSVLNGLIYLYGFVIISFDCVFLSLQAIAKGIRGAAGPLWSSSSWGRKWSSCTSAFIGCSWYTLILVISSDRHVQVDINAMHLCTAKRTHKNHIESPWIA